VTLQEQIQWGDEVFDVDLGVASTFDILLLPVSYRFSLVKSDRVDLGLSAGVFAMFADASIAAPEIDAAEAESANFPLPVFGADARVLSARALRDQGRIPVGRHQRGRHRPPRRGRVRDRHLLRLPVPRPSGVRGGQLLIGPDSIARPITRADARTDTVKAKKAPKSRVAGMLVM
jgi:hypothetical protein